MALSLAELAAEGGVSRRPAGDVWAFGVLLYEMIAGQPPFTGRTSFDLAAAILNLVPAPLPLKTSPALAATSPVAFRKILPRDTERRATYCSRWNRSRSARRSNPRRLPGTTMSRGSASTHAKIFSLIVLPFDNVSGNASDDYFANGMTDVLLTDLSRLF